MINLSFVIFIHKYHLISISILIYICNCVFFYFNYLFEFMLFIFELNSNCFPQNYKNSTEVMSKFIALTSMIKINSINMRETPITSLGFIQKCENYPDFLCMNAMHKSVSSLFVVPKLRDVTASPP